MHAGNENAGIDIWGIMALFWPSLDIFTSMRLVSRSQLRNSRRYAAAFALHQLQISTIPFP